MMNGDLNPEHKDVLEQLAEGARWATLAGINNYDDRTLSDAAKDALRVIECLRLLRKRHARSFTKWTEEEDERLYELWSEHLPVWMICEQLQRSEYAVRKRLDKLVKREGYERIDRPDIIERQSSLGKEAA